MKTFFLFIALLFVLSLSNSSTPSVTSAAALKEKALDPLQAD